MAGNKVHQSSVAILTTAFQTPLVGDPVERPDFDAYCECGINGSAAGLVAIITIGGQTETDSHQVNALNRFPVLPDDLILRNSLCPAGAQNRIRINNPTAGTLTPFVFFKASIFPAAR